MKRVIAIAVLALGCVGIAIAQAPTAAAPNLTSVLDRQISGPEREFVSLAEAMPNDKFNFAPTQGEFKGVRTFAQQVKHVAATNYELAAAILGEKPPADAQGENGPDRLKSKAEIIDYLKASFTQLHKALASINEKNATEPIPSPYGPNKTTRMGLAVMDVGHIFDHYGQLVVYGRMNGIIPPASRR